MALRNILDSSDKILSKICRPVETFDAHLGTLLDDMAETLTAADGVGLAAPQVGVLRRIALVNVEGKLVELLNPEITKTSGEQREIEGCLSCPGRYGITVRPMSVRVKAQDRRGKSFEVEGEGLTARAFCHEIDHLNGILFLDHMIEEVDIKEM